MMIKINGIEVSECEHFDVYLTRKCDGKYSCASSPNCEFKQKKRKQKKKENEKE